MSGNDAFQFIVSNGPRPDPASRRTIRRQAMKDVGLSRRRGNQIRTNRNHTPKGIQEEPSPSFSPDSPSASNSTTSDMSTPSTEPTDFEDIETNNPPSQGLEIINHSKALPPIVSISTEDYWHVRSKSAIDLSSLAIFTNFNIGKSTISTLANSASRLPTVLYHQQWSYLEYIPQRYSHSKCLAAAADCILAKIGNVLSPRAGAESSVLRLYAKALQLVQQAVASSSCIDSDVLCAIQLLSLHELFDPSTSGAWESHVEGSARLIRHRSIRRFDTDFDKALFAASVGPYVSQCLYKGTYCYLAEPNWRQLYLSLAEPTDHLTDRSELVIGLRSQTFGLPGLWSDVGQALEGDDLFDDSVLSALAQRSREVQMGILNTLEDYKAHVVRTAFAQPSSDELALRREVYGLAHELLILVKRLQALVCDADRLRLEAEVQEVAQSVFDLQDQPVPQHSWLFSGHELGVAQLASSTSDLFTEDVSMQSWKDQRLAMRKRYMLWSGSLRTF